MQTLMLNRQSIWIALVLGAVATRGAALAPAPVDVVTRLADGLVDRQITTGPSRGTWTDEEAHSGTIVAGLVRAYELTCDERYREAAEGGAQFFVTAAAGNFYGDEAYALTALSELPGEGGDNRWASLVGQFYDDVRTRAAGGTAGYVSEFAQAELTAAVFYVANHTVAAYYADALDRHIWREALIDYLSRVDDSHADFPVLALGAATWALARTGPLDESIVACSSQSVPYWQQKRLSDLPSMLMDHQVGADGPVPGSFYWRFDHGSDTLGGPASGYMEDLVFASLGLVAAAKAHPSSGLEAAIRTARRTLIEALQGSDLARQHVSQMSAAGCVYTGEALQAFAELLWSGDLDVDGDVDGIDFSLWADNWRESEGLEPCRCGRADLNGDGLVDLRDLVLFADGWLKPA